MALPQGFVLEQPNQSMNLPTGFQLEGVMPQSIPQVTESQFAAGGGAAVGRPVRGVRLNVQPTPRPLESFAAGATRSVIDPLLAGAQMVTGGRGGVSEAVKRLAQESEVYEQANPASYIGGRVGGAVLPALS